MSRSYACSAVLVAATLLGGCVSVPREQPVERPPLVLVSLDGFRFDFDQLARTPNLDLLVARGVRAKRLIPVFPSKTFPAHYTVVTGLRAENHGIVANTMWDPELGARFTLADRDAVGDARWWGGEPIWVTAERQGRHTAVLFWPGSEAAIGGVRPRHWALYQHEMAVDERIDWLAARLALPPEERPAFFSLYFDHVDTAAHDHGLESAALESAIELVDGALGLLLAALEPHGGLDAVNVVVLADHGMADLSRDRVILLDQLVPGWDDSWVVDWGPVLALRPPPEHEDTVYQALAEAHPHLEVWRRDEVPERFRYRAHRRIAPIIALADEGWTVATSAYLARRPSAATGANHGYDPYLESMGALFVAAGPSFRAGVTVEPFESVHLYELFCELLNLEPAPNDGRPGALGPILRDR